MGRIISIAQVPAEISVFIDANIFIYHFIYETAESQMGKNVLPSENMSVKICTLYVHKRGKECIQQP